MGGRQSYTAAILYSSTGSDTSAVRDRELTNGDTFGDTVTRNAP
jgi:hypothetical protein